MPSRDTDWDCLACKRCLGWITFDRFERAHLNCSLEVTGVQQATGALTPSPYWTVGCVCGETRNFFGYAVHLKLANAA